MGGGAGYRPEQVASCNHSLFSYVTPRDNILKEHMGVCAKTPCLYWNLFANLFEANLRPYLKKIQVYPNLPKVQVCNI